MALHTARFVQSVSIERKNHVRALPTQAGAQVYLWSLDGRQHGARPVRRAGAPADLAGRDRPHAGRGRRVRRQFPRQRSGADRRHPGRARPDCTRLQGRAPGDRSDRADGDHQPVHRPGLQGRRVHRQRPAGARLRAPENHARDRPGRRMRREGLRVLGRARGRRDGCRQRPAGSRQALPRGAELPVRLRHGPGLRSEVRPGAQAERAARRYLPRHRRPRAGLYRRRWTIPRWSASTPRWPTKRWPG